MRVCLMIEGQEGVTWDDWVRLARLAEQHGLEGLFRSDHYTAIIRPDADAHDAWATLAGLAAITERIRLGTLVSPATFRHPSVLARMAVTVDHISGGRVEVGMGSGWYEREHEAHGFPFLDGEAAVRALRRAGRGRRPLVDRGALRPRGPRVHAPRAAGAAAPVQQPHPPLVLGGTVKPRFAALAARYATEVNTLGAPNDELRERKAALDRACAEAGRDPATLGYSVMTACFVGETRAEVVERVGASSAIRGGDADPESAHRRAERPLARRHRRRGRRAHRRAARRSASRASSSST